MLKSIALLFLSVAIFSETYLGCSVSFSESYKINSISVPQYHSIGFNYLKDKVIYSLYFSDNNNNFSCDYNNTTGEMEYVYTTSKMWRCYEISRVFESNYCDFILGVGLQQEEMWNETLKNHTKFTPYLTMGGSINITSAIKLNITYDKVKQYMFGIMIKCD